MKKIFFATPIGSVDSKEYQRSNKIVEAITNILEQIEDDLELIRVDKIFKPNNITETIKQEIAESNFIIADISNHNPNVYYELGYATGLQKTCIQIAEKSNKNLPFDVAQINTIFYDLDDIKSLKFQLEEMIKYVLSNPSERHLTFSGPVVRKVEVDDKDL